MLELQKSTWMQLKMSVGDDRRTGCRKGLDNGWRLILSTPLGARGLDIPHCSHIYLYGLPATADDYLHAAGRC